MNSYVLDAYAWMALICDEPDATQVQDLLEPAARGEAIVATAAINIGEVFYRLEREVSASHALHSALEMEATGGLIVLPTMAQVLLAAHLKANHPASYADCFCAALAIELDATVVTGDPEFKLFEPNLKVLWLP